MMRCKSVSLLFCLIIVLITLSDVKATTGLGITPAHIELTNLLKGESYYRSIRIFNPSNRSITLNLSASGDIESWVRFYRKGDLNHSITSITIEGSKEEITVEFRIPRDIANGLYEGYVFAETIPDKNATNASVGSVKLRLPVSVSATVTGTQILDGKVTNINTRDVEEGYPLRIGLDFINTGNVRAKPVIMIYITRSGWPIDNITYSKDTIDVDSAGTITVEWNTSNREPGTYEARVLVMLGEKMIADENLTFNILPRGTLTRRGELVNMFYEGEPSVGSTIKILADFKNTGKIEVKAKFVGEVYRNEKLIDVLESDEILVLVGNTFRFTTYLKLGEGGKYRIQGYVSYEVNKTSTRVISFEVKSFLGSSTAYLSVVAIFVSGSIFYLIYRRKR